MVLTFLNGDNYIMIKRKSSHGQKIFDRINTKMERIESSAYKSAGTKYTWIAAFYPLGEHSARVILGSTRPISPMVAKSCVEHSTQFKLQPFLASFTPVDTSDKDIYYASVCASSTNLITLPVNGETDDIMSMITATTFMDTQLNKVWERRDIGGQQFYVRANDENPEDILQATMLASTDTRFRVQPDKFIITRDAQPGDYVRFFGLNASTQEGSREFTPFMEVAQVEANENNVLSICIKEDGFESKAKISAHACTDLIKVESAGDAMDTTRKDVIDYLSKVYPEPYVNVVKETYGR